MTGTTEVSSHYTSGELMARLRSALADDGADPERPTMEALAPYDQFHGRGMEATEQLAGRLTVAVSDHLLDVGSGIGGPARYIADRFGCRVTGIDLTEEFCAVARELTGQLGLAERVAFEQGNALEMPFADACFDGAYSMNVSMNIADKVAFYREIHRVLRPRAWLVLSELAQGPNGSPDFPTPWARTADSSFLATPAQTTEGLEAAGFVDLTLRETAEESKDFGARSRAAVERGEKPPHRAIHLVHGDIAAEAIANSGRGVAEGRTIPIEVFCRKPA
ncbi:MAG: methyltransferase domain-containing protein [Kiloniellales bacterium]|nr:methyltransferase domain-containing protein [Kiloniellales bacterium]